MAEGGRERRQAANRLCAHVNCPLPSLLVQLFLPRFTNNDRIITGILYCLTVNFCVVRPSRMRPNDATAARELRRFAPHVSFSPLVLSLNLFRQFCASRDIRSFVRGPPQDDSSVSRELFANSFDTVYICRAENTPARKKEGFVILDSVIRARARDRYGKVPYLVVRQRENRWRLSHI